MRVLFFIDSMLPAGGQERVVAQHTVYFNRMGYDVTICTKSREGSFYRIPESTSWHTMKVSHDRFNLTRVGRIFTKLCNIPITVLRLRKLIRDIEPDFVYVSSPFNAFELVLAGYDPNKVIVSEHSSFGAHNTIYRSWIKQYYPNFKYFLVPTKGDTRIYEAMGMRPFYLPNPIAFPISEYKSSENKVILNIGRFCADKRQLLLLEIWSLANCRHHGWILKIIGEGELETDLRRFIRDNNLESSVILQKPTSDIVKEYQEASIFCLTSKMEGFGLVLVEAMANSTPCLSFDVPSGPRDIIEDSVCGVLVSDNDINTYVEELEKLCHDRWLRVTLSKNANKKAQNFSDEVIFNKFKAIFAG